MPQRNALRTTAYVLTAAAVAARLAKAYRQRKRRRRQREREAAYRVGPAWRRLRVAPSTIEGAGEGLGEGLGALRHAPSAVTTRSDATA